MKLKYNKKGDKYDQNGVVLTQEVKQGKGTYLKTFRVERDSDPVDVPDKVAEQALKDYPEVLQKVK